MKIIRRHGLTLIEVLVVIAITAVMIALLVPAVQKLRAAAALTQCTNNLKQVGLAAHGFHDAKKAFPAGMRFQYGTDPYRYMSWLTQLLPYADQDPLWLSTQRAYAESRSPFKNPPHIGLATVMPVFTCPADWRVSDPHLAPRNHYLVAFTSYLGVIGKDVATHDGILYRDSSIRIAEVTDGTSNTLLAGERPPSADFQFGWWYAGAGQRSTGSADMILGVLEENLLPVTAGSCPPGAYPFGPGDLANQCDMFHFWSLHPGGANFLLADGSVRFLSYSAAPLMPALASRNGGEAAEVP